jgi:glycosyltransferase involved in cell wall biosynthesis
VRPSLSVVIITHNEEKNIRRCLKSLKRRFVSIRLRQVLVVDSQSTDRTAAVARRLGAKVVVRPWPGYSAQKNWALKKCRGDWILSLDADEEMTGPLWREIEAALPSSPPDVQGYFIPRRAYFLGKWMRHCGWWPDAQLRLIKRGKGRFNSNLVHEGLEVQGRTAALQAPMNHYSYDSLSRYILKMEEYSTLAALRPPEKKIRFWPYYLLIDPFVVFFRMYVSRRGFLDGWHGLVVCLLSAFHDLVRYAKVWERHVLKRGASADGRVQSR